MSNFKKIVADLLDLRRPDLKVLWFHLPLTDPNLLDNGLKWGLDHYLVSPQEEDKEHYDEKPIKKIRRGD